MNLRRSILWLFLLFLGAASLTAREPKLTEAEVIRLANEAAKKADYDLMKYEAPKVRYEFAHKNDSWWVSYQGKHRAPGNYFVVTIHDKTKETTVIHGE